MATDAIRLQDLFAAALERDGTDRARFLERECANDAPLLAELRALLAADAKVADLTAPPLAPELSGVLADLVPGSLTGSRVGAFELREELGRGGMGSVYRAERVDGTVRQQVAVKFVLRERLDANMLRMFALERELMAALDHPYVARLIDAAQLDDGTPYYVMEYVAGASITEFCERSRLDVRARVELLRKVCDAVAEAHRKLVVHRDLKPTNILVSVNGTPKLVDFGIARPHGSLDAAGDRFFSLQYAAPEQVAGGDVGTACDVHALGVVLYELLTRRKPFDFAGMAPAQAARVV
ncbi:MAG TPA: serine/threonine-protein kinase, partial [Xanthomonadales bacterium]|nr:serine/threonine-protein kinase [Xanthomonadales bacterium]